MRAIKLFFQPTGYLKNIIQFFVRSASALQPVAQFLLSLKYLVYHNFCWETIKLEIWVVEFKIRCRAEDQKATKTTWHWSCQFIADILSLLLEK